MVVHIASPALEVRHGYPTAKLQPGRQSLKTSVLDRECSTSNFRASLQGPISIGTTGLQTFGKGKILLIKTYGRRNLVSATNELWYK